MNLISIAAAAVLVLASFNEAAPAKEKRATKLPGLDKIKHVVYFMQVCLFIFLFFDSSLKFMWIANYVHTTFKIGKPFF